MNIHLKLRAGFVGALLLLISSGVISQICIKHFINEAAWIAHTHEVIGELTGFSAAVHIAQTEQQAYLLRDNQPLKTSLQDAQQQITADFARVRLLTADNPRQQRRLEGLKPLLDVLLATGEAAIASAGNNREKSAVPYALTSDSNKQAKQRIEICFWEMRNEEELLLQQRFRLSHDAASFAVVAVGASTLLCLILVSFCALWIGRELRLREQAEATLHQAYRPWQQLWQRLWKRKQKLEVRVRERTAELSKIAASLEAEVTEHRKTEGDLRQSEQRYRLLFEDSPIPMAVFDAESLAFLAVNEAAEALYGYTREEFLHMTRRDVWPVEEVPAQMGFLNTVKNDDSYTHTFIAQLKDRELITIESRVRSIEFDGRRAHLSQMTDITENKRLESQLRQSQKMEAIGNLAGGIAHDFNNLLTVILGYSDSILRQLGDADPIHVKVAEIQAAGERAARLTSQLLAFSRKQILQPQILELNGVVSNISAMLRRLLGEDIKFSLHLDENLAQVKADPGQLEQVLLNLAVNARDAMPQGGQLVIESHNVELNEHTALLQGVPPGEYVLLQVCDTGCGMDEPTKARVFEPFFTTKDVGKGTGLGLAMVLGVVQQSGGAVTISSEVGIGTTFKIYLPRLDTPAEQRSLEPMKSHSLPLPTENGGTILLVEDEPSLRALARAVLGEAGYEVLEACNGKEALRLADGLTSSPALLLTDVVMPEMGGLELAKDLQRKWPGLAVLYASGYTDHALLERNTLRHDMPFLQKPYMPQSLLEHVAAVLEVKRRPMVLIVDDEKQIRDQLRTSFEEAGYQVVHAVDGRQAMKQVSTHPVKLVITDLLMPELDGLEMIRRLRQDYPGVKIIAISGASESAYLSTARMLGADAVLPKPFLQEQVMQAAETLLVQG